MIGDLNWEHEEERGIPMRHYIVDYDCFWDENYPTPHTCGTFPLHVQNNLEVIYYIKNYFLNMRSLLNYHFIIDTGTDVFEIKKGE